MNLAIARAVLVLLFVFAGTALAEAPQQKGQVPGYYRMMLGSFEVTALFDGAIQLDEKLLKDVTKEDLDKLLARQFLQGPKVQTAVNAYLVNTGGKLVLVDTGAAGAFGPSLGNVIANLKAAGYAPEQVDAVLLTHLHGDHVSGLLTTDGKVAFPNAEVWAAKAEAEYWLDEKIAAKAPKEAQGFFKMARDATAPYLAAKKWKTFMGEIELWPGVFSWDTPGHTPGHANYFFLSGDARLLVLGDLVHSHAVQFARPDVAIEFDVDPKRAVETRKRIFELAAKDRMIVAGMHLPFPGIGHVRREAEGFAWVPIEFGPLPK